MHDSIIIFFRNECQYIQIAHFIYETIGHISQTSKKILTVTIGRGIMNSENKNRHSRKGEMKNEKI